MGGLNLLYTEPTTWQSWQQRRGRVLADLTVLGLSRERDPARTHRLAEQTLTALNDRVMLADAIGMVAGALEIDTDAAQDLIFVYVEEHRRAPRDVARALTNGTLDPAALGPSR